MDDIPQQTRLARQDPAMLARLEGFDEPGRFAPQAAGEASQLPNRARRADGRRLANGNQ